MTKAILGKKIGMSQIFNENGKVIPVTVVETGPCIVTQIRTEETDKYSAIQLGLGERKSKNVSNAVRGHIKKSIADGKFFSSKDKAFMHLKEFRVDSPEVKVGDRIDVSIFEEGDKVSVAGISKGKGFQGVVKRHGFAGSPATHGHRHMLRRAGSTGSRFPQHSRKGLRMAGHTGLERIFIKNLKIVQIDTENNTLALKGAVPGHRGTLLEIVGK